jgi:LPXTG-motif cell wall-anchored protein
MKNSSVLRKRFAITSLLFVGVIAGNQLVAVAAEGPQTSSISSMSVSNLACSTSGYAVNLTGVFPELVTNVAVNDTNLAATSYTQTASNIAINIPGSSAKSFTITVYNGQDPVMASKVFTCVEPVVVILPPVEETEDGGLLPDTGSNNYNYLVAGIGLALFGSRSLLRRKLIQE